MSKLNKAILLIDFQNEFTTKGGKLHENVSEVIQNTCMMEKVPDLVDLGRECGATIIHSPIVTDEDVVVDEDDTVMSNLLKGKMFEKGSWNAKITKELQPEATDYVLKGRKTTSVFKGTVLSSLLKRNKIDVLFIAGFLTDGCILQAVQEAYDAVYGDDTSIDDKNELRPIQIVVLSDGTAAYSTKIHMNMLTNVIPEFCDVATVDYAEEMLIKDDMDAIPNRQRALGFSIFDPIKKLRIAMIDKWLPGERFVRFLDTDGDGMVDYQEFYDFLNHFNLISDDIDPKTIFNILDLDGDGEIPTQVVVDSLKARDDDVEEDPDVDRMDIIKAKELPPFPSPFLVSLVAHNNMKPSMMKFVKDNITFFSRVKLVTTGSTGRALKSLGLKVEHLVASGPLGGDQEIGGLIAQGKVCAVFFFVDPLSAHPHAADIGALNRICCVCDVMFANNPSTATALVYSLENSSFGYSCLCGVNPQYQLDSSIVVKYKDSQNKVIADVSAGKNNDVVNPIIPKDSKAASFRARGSHKASSHARSSRRSSVGFMEENEIPEFIERKANTGVRNSILKASTKSGSHIWLDGI
eukprot:CAMPEP_0194166010 /NCGR_PEP_ID=MMETSP0154-20130528/1754_1 /TAXON_ID=1049557 /ORGANISM="Thalassiothrix antarctica, Strain L6-D1" /LENGTH=577 /DNA_ID=CAMNT_0038876583 /DNA_START=63 /DNA_END=1796 /DNA_ORIENTATION=-